ncbi:DUF732 domain-containing protein [Corynebacterium xerosis]|uniref:DUF732 domain-containing protein n=1 Tax=Corynebacterium xerosis TaxID=1725 RepID=UPI00069BA97A|nr:DUF732 domain-containing protein [Corynebacterium xerosis]SQB96098.1 Uncharacterised protein [Clostridium paraputrificum]
MIARGRGTVGGGGGRSGGSGRSADGGSSIGVKARAATMALIGAGALALAACGGSTVESSEVTDTTTTTAESSASETSTSESSTTRTSERADGERDITEPGAARASDAPDGRMPLSGDDEDFLDALIADDIDVEGTEDQLIAAGHVHCDAGADGGTPEDALVIDAVAGQLVAQERTDKDEAAVTEAIAKAAESAYC